MNNPFEVIDARLSNIESLLLDLKHTPPTNEQNILNELYVPTPPYFKKHSF